MKKNVIILTTGSSGSSVLAGLIATQGYWLGDETKKLNFDTYENAQLVDLNVEVLRATGFKRRDCNDLPPPSIEAIRELPKRINLKPFHEFLKKCDNHQPWLWKDPRLTFTIHFWQQIVDLKQAKYALIDRDPYQSYAGLILSRKVPMSFKEQSLINDNYIESCTLFSKGNNLQMFKCNFEDLILNPEKFLKQLNTFLELQIDLNDLRLVYKGRLYQKRYSDLDFIKAKLLYFCWRYVARDYVVFPRED